jgi:hypothetical protein
MRSEEDSHLRMMCNIIVMMRRRIWRYMIIRMNLEVKGSINSRMRRRR